MLWQHYFLSKTNETDILSWKHSLVQKKVFLEKSSFFFFFTMPLLAMVPHSQVHVTAVDIESMKRGK